MSRSQVGKSTILREMSRLLADAFGQLVVVADTTSELGGFGSTHHPALGARATRLKVPRGAFLKGTL